MRSEIKPPEHIMSGLVATQDRSFRKLLQKSLNCFCGSPVTD
jgi:hypothetical protein